MPSPARVAQCQLRPPTPVARSKEQLVPVQIPVPKSKPAEIETTNIVMQPRVCNLRSYSSDRPGILIRTRKDGVDAGDDASTFFATLSEYIESSQKSHDFEIISGRLAMMVFAGTVTMEIVTGNSVFRKMEAEGIVEAGGVCLGAVGLAAIFAWLSSARNRVGNMFTMGCNTLIDSLIDQIVDRLFYESELSDWSDEL